MASPEAQATFEAFRQVREATGGSTPSLEEVRAGGEMFGQMTAEPAAVVYEDVDVDGVPGQWISAAAPTNAGVILYLHGGGYMACSVNSHKRLVGHIVAAAGCRALAIDYRRTPEAVHPAQVDDAVAAYRWLLRSGHRSDLHRTRRRLRRWAPDPHDPAAPTSRRRPHPCGGRAVVAVGRSRIDRRVSRLEGRCRPADHP